jgi:RNA recognition motif-containing protein
MTLYVSNLTSETTREELLKAFQAHGEVESVTLPADRMKGGSPTGARRGYGFVVMRDRAEARAAIKAMDGTAFHGRAVSVRVANAKWTPTYAN